MALTKTLTRESDVPVPDAYRKITDVTVQAHGLTVLAKYIVSTYLDKETSDAAGKVLDQVSFDCEIVDKTGNIYAALYADVKARPELDGAVDVLDP